MDAMKKRIETLPYHATKRMSISAQLIAYWGFVPEAIEAIYDYVDQIIVAYGPTEHSKAFPPDDTLRLLRSVPDPRGIIEIEERPLWHDKLEKRSWCAKRIKGNWHLLLDGDEVWTGFDKWIAGKHVCAMPRWVNFWHDAKHWAYDLPKDCGRRWGHRVGTYGSMCVHYRWSAWRGGYRFKTHCTIVDAQGNKIHAPTREIAEATPATAIYHFGHCLPKETMFAKHEFYLARDGADKGRVARKDAWHNWSGKTGECGDGVVAEVDWDLPEIIKRAAANLEARNGQKDTAQK